MAEENNNNLRFYNQVRQVPENAKREITSGRLKGKTDINPMWRIKALTELYGPVGIGWKYIITRKEIVDGANGEKAAFVDIDLYYKEDGVWSEAIPGTGGASFVTKESKGMHTNDECYKMALTDAISVAAKAIGVAADVYWNKDSTKYSNDPDSDEDYIFCDICRKKIKIGDGIEAMNNDTGEVRMICKNCARKVGIIS